MISRETDYAFRIMRALSNGERSSLQEICKQEYIPQPYAYKIIKKLEKAHLVSIFRGSKGGYELNCDLKVKTFYDLYHAIEGELLLNACQIEGSVCPNRADHKDCNVHIALENMQAQFIEIMSRQPLSTLI